MTLVVTNTVVKQFHPIKFELVIESRTELLEFRNSLGNSRGQLLLELYNKLNELAGRE